MFATSFGSAAWAAGLRRQLALAALALAPAWAARAQAVPTAPAADTLRKYQTPPGAPRPPWYRGKLVRATAVPAVLIGYGISTVNGHGFYSSYDAKRDVRRTFGTYRNHVDDFLQYAPYAELGAVLLAGVESRNDRVNLGLVVLKSEAIMLGSVFLVKRTTGVLRPDSTDRLSFPSGHTAQAFLAASIVHTELRDKSPWYGVGAYALATSVGAFRMINNKHWQSDVFAGAGFGILSAHLAYLSHRHRWGRRPAERGRLGLAVPAGPAPAWRFAPAVLPGGGLGVTAVWRAR